jgi:transposase
MITNKSAYPVKLTPEERRYLWRIIRSGGNVQKKNRCRILLALSDAKRTASVRQMLPVLQTSEARISRLRRKFFEKGLAVAINGLRKPRGFTGPVADKIVALARTPAPEGRKRWTSALLVRRIVELKIAETISEETVRTVLKRANINTGWGRCTGKSEAEIVALARSAPPQGYERWNVNLLVRRIVELKIAPCISRQSVLKILKKENLTLPRGVVRKFDSETVAKIIALARSAPPQGYERWTSELLARRIVELKIAETISKGTVRNVLKRANINTGRGKRAKIKARNQARLNGEID